MVAQLFIDTDGVLHIKTQQGKIEWKKYKVDTDGFFKEIKLGQNTKN